MRMLTKRQARCCAELHAVPECLCTRQVHCLRLEFQSQVVVFYMKQCFKI
ncbi:hypothetical protein CBL_06755 [Carabus blaptoides fortunei]